MKKNVSTIARTSSFQAICEWGRESIESLGKRRRRSLANSTEEKAEDMTLSQEILVLDFGDEKQSEFFKSDASIDFNEAGKIAHIKILST